MKYMADEYGHIMGEPELTRLVVPVAQLVALQSGQKSTGNFKATNIFEIHLV